MKNLNGKSILPEQDGMKEQIQQLEEDKLVERAASYFQSYFNRSSYFKRLLPLAIFVGLLALFANAVSVFTAQTFGITLVSSFAPTSIAIGLVIFFLIAWEGIKHFHFKNVFDDWQVHRKVSMAQVLGLIALVGISALLSFKGGKSRVLHFSKKPDLINVDSIKAYYDLQITDNRTKISAHMGRLAKKDEWNTRHKTIPGLERENERLAKERDDKVLRAEGKNDLTLAGNNREVTINAATVGYIAICADFLLLVCWWFLSRYHYKSAQELQLQFFQTSNSSPPPSSLYRRMKPYVGRHKNDSRDFPDFSTATTINNNSAVETCFNVFQQEPEAPLMIKHWSDKDQKFKWYNEDDVKGMLNTINGRYQKAIQKGDQVSAEKNKERVDYWNGRLQEFQLSKAQ